MWALLGNGCACGRSLCRASKRQAQAMGSNKAREHAPVTGNSARATGMLPIHHTTNGPHSYTILHTEDRLLVDRHRIFFAEKTIRLAGLLRWLSRVCLQHGQQESAYARRCSRINARVLFFPERAHRKCHVTGQPTDQHVRHANHPATPARPERKQSAIPHSPRRKAARPARLSLFFSHPRPPDVSTPPVSGMLPPNGSGGNA